MSDGSQGSDEVDGGKHAGAAQLAAAAARAEARGDDALAARLFDQALRTDPDAVANALQQDDTPPPRADVAPADDEAVASISRTIVPGADAPSRAGITGTGSGADDMGE